MALWLDGRLLRKGLTDKQKRIAREIVCGLTASLAVQGDEAMQALHDTHSPHSLADGERAATADLQQAMEDALGESLGEGGNTFESMDELMRAAMEKMNASQAAQQAAKDERDARRNAKKKKSLAQLKKEELAAAQAQDADGALRTLYRQLVSALHPDREPDPQEHIRKTALMKEANAAYERRDLLALLQLQLRADLADGDMVASMAKEKLAAMTALLKERVAVLNRELYAVEQQAIHEFELPPYSPFSEASLKRQLVMRQQDLQADIAMMQQDLVRVQDDAHLKRWLKQQHALAQDDEFDPIDFF
jgi:Arc/MetJ-type ribon-helix-helix transcriptional regulator